MYSLFIIVLLFLVSSILCSCYVFLFHVNVCCCSLCFPFCEVAMFSHAMSTFAIVLCVFHFVQLLCFLIPCQCLLLFLVFSILCSCYVFSSHVNVCYCSLCFPFCVLSYVFPCAANFSSFSCLTHICFTLRLINKINIQSTNTVINNEPKI